MNDMLDKSWLKIIKICISIYAVIWMVMVIIFFCLCLFSEDWYQYPVLIWPFIHTMFVCVSFYKFYKLLKNNNDSISKLQTKIWLLELSRNMFFSCFYLSVAAEYILGMICFLSLAMASIFCLNYIKKN